MDLHRAWIASSEGHTILIEAHYNTYVNQYICTIHSCIAFIYYIAQKLESIT